MMGLMRERLVYVIAGALAIAVVAAFAGVVSGGPLDPPGPPASTGPLEAVLQPAPGRVIPVATDLPVAPTAAPAIHSAARSAVQPVSYHAARGAESRFAATGSTGLLMDLTCVAPDSGACTYNSGTTTIVVNVVVTNQTGASAQLGALGFDVTASNAASLTPNVPACDASGLNCNPDFNQGAVTGTFSCSPPAPAPDNDASAGTANSSLGCFNGSADGPTLANNASITLGTVTYTASADGVHALTLNTGALASNVYDASFTELGSCPTIGADMQCTGITVQVGGSAATATPTTTPQATATPSPTYSPCGVGCPTATPLGGANPPAGSVALGYFDVRDCKSLNVFASSHVEVTDQGSSNLEIRVQASIDGLQSFGPIFFEGGAFFLPLAVGESGADTNASRRLDFGETDLSSPYVGVFATLRNGSVQPVRLNAWLYCVPRP